MHRRLRTRAATVEFVAAVVLAAVLAVTAAACGGDSSTAPGEGTPTATATLSPTPISTVAPLCTLGEAARFQTPQGAIMRVRAAGFADPGEPAEGVSAAADERLVTLRFTVTVESTGGDPAARLPFAGAESFLLIAADDMIYVAKLTDHSWPRGKAAGGETASTTLAWALPSGAQPARFVCTPVEGSTPRSATWLLEE